MFFFLEAKVKHAPYKHDEHAIEVVNFIILNGTIFTSAYLKLAIL